jgi:hypothetical protein
MPDNQQLDPANPWDRRLAAYLEELGAYNPAITFRHWAGPDETSYEVSADSWDARSQHGAGNVRHFVIRRPGQGTELVGELGWSEIT